MSTYEILPESDANLDITITDGETIVIDIIPASFTLPGGDVASVNGYTGVVQLDTDDIPEGLSNLYYTDERVDERISLIDYPVDSVNGLTGDVVLTTTEVAEGVNQYYTDERVDTYLTGGEVTSINFGGATSLSWNSDEGTLEFPVNAEVTLQIGQENLIHVKNLSGSTLNNGAVVRVTGASGSKLTIDLANNTSDAVSADTIAVMTQSLNNNAVGYATTEGLVRGLNTSSYTEGAVLWLDGAGVFTQTKPLTPLHLVQVGYVVRSHPTQGSIFVCIKNGWELDELHDVLITGITDGQGLVWDAGNGYWKNETISVDLTGYATEAYVDAAIPTNVSAFTNDAGYATEEYVNSQLSGISVPATTDDLLEGSLNLYYSDTLVGDYLTANNYATTDDIPTDVSAFNNDAGYITDPGNTFTTDGQFTFVTDYGIPAWEPYNGEFKIANYTDPDNNLLNTVRFLTSGGNAFAQYDVVDTGGGDDGSHRVELRLSGNESAILTDNALNIGSDQLTLNSANNLNISGGSIELNSNNPLHLNSNTALNLNATEHNFVNDGTVYINGLDSTSSYVGIQYNSTQTVYNSITDSTEELNIPFRIIRKHTDAIDYADDTQILIQFGAGEGGNFYQLGQLGGRFDRIDGHETKLQTMNPADNSLLNNWTVHEHYLYGGKPIRQTYYNNAGRDGLALVQDGMLIWNTEGNELQVYHDSTWNSVGGGGGGASALDDLTDVTISAVSDGDILRYNGIAMEWQNTNLGLSLTPLISIESSFVGATNICTITNYGDYEDPNIWAQVKDSGGTVVITNSQITDKYDGTFSFTTPPIGTGYVLEVKVQDFGDLASDTATATFDSLAIPAARYYRIKFINATSYNMIDRVQLFTGPAQSGTLYPTTGMTSNTAPAPYVASAEYVASVSYDAYEAFDNIVGGTGRSWWNLGSSNYAGSWVQIDLGSSIQIASFILNPITNPSYINCDGWLIYTSNTGAFAGEEVLRATIDRIPGIYEYTVG